MAKKYKKRAATREKKNATARRKGGFVVRGVVRHADGHLCAGALVRAYDLDLRNRQLLGKRTTGANGKYAIPYTAGMFCRAEKGGADLHVAVVDAKGRELASADLPAAPARAVVNLTLAAAPEERSEYELLVGFIEPLLEGQGDDGRDLSIAGLEEKDFDFLARESGQPRERITFLAAAAQDSALSAGPSAGTGAAMRARQSADSGIPAAAFYGWFRQGLPTLLDALFATDERSLTDALATSQQQKIIPAIAAATLSAILARAQALRRRTALGAGSDHGRPSLGDLLGVALPGAKHDVIAEIWVAQVRNPDALAIGPAAAGAAVSLDNAGDLQAFWQALASDSRLTADDVRQVKTTLALNQLTVGHLPLVRELSRTGATGPGALAALSESDWVAVLNRPQNPDDPASPPIGAPAGQGSVEAYAHTLAQAVENAFPTPVLADRIARNTEAAGPLADAKADLAVFFKNNPDFAFGATPLVRYLNGDAEQKLRGVQDPAKLRQVLTGMERVSKFAPRFEPMQALLADGITSAQATISMGAKGFSGRYGPAFGGDGSAANAYAGANAIGMAALNLFLKLGTPANAPLPYALDPTGDGPVDVSAFTGTDRATWNDLFGSLDMCNCDECDSLYGPPAYFADLLVFLRQQAGGDGTPPLDVLLARRPDLAQLELTCDNAEIELPYIDLVNEVLENAVADPVISIIGDFSATDFDKGDLVGDLVLPLGLSSKATLVPDVPKTSWAIRDPGWRYVFSMNAAGTGVDVRPYPQTAGTQADLAANPQHVNGNAYAKLAPAGYPWSLPFNLPVEQARAYLHQLGVERYQLMEALQTSWAALADDAIAAEYLGLSTVAAGIITGAVTADPNQPPVTGVTDRPWTFWGFATETVTVHDPSQPASNSDANLHGSWVDVLKRVPIFLSQSGLAYGDLLALLDTYFNNPVSGASRTLSITSLNPAPPATCDLTKLEITGLTATILVNIHRFVRLQRALGWSVRDLDRALTAFGATDLNPPGLLRQLSHVRRLQVRLKLPVVSLLAFWTDLDTAAYANPGADESDAAGLPSLYDELFRNKTVVSPVDEAFTEDARKLTGALADHAATILGALRISAAELTALTSGARAAVTDGLLDTANLSMLYRYATLAQALKLSVADLLEAKRLIGAGPFDTTAETVRFVRRIDAVGASGFDVGTLAYLLRCETSDPGLQPALDAQSAALLGDLRSGLAKIDDDNAVVADPVGELTRKKLAQLRWSDVTIEAAIALLGDADAYRAPLPALPAGLVFPPALGSRVSYDAPTQTLRFRGVMSNDDRTSLQGATHATTADLSQYLPAVDAIFNASRAEAKTLLTDHLRAFELPVFVAPAAPKPPLSHAVALPEEWKNRVQYDDGAGQLKAVGPVTEADVTELLKLSADTAYQDAVRSLLQQAITYVPKPDNAFLLSLADPATDPAHTSFIDLFDSGKSSAERFAYVLDKLCTYLRRTLSDSLVKHTLADAFALNAAVVDLLLTALLTAPGNPGNQAITDLTDPDWVHSHGDVSPDNYPNQFALVARLRSVTTVVSRLRITAAQLGWIAQVPVSAGWLRWDQLPVTPTAAPVAFSAWEELLTGLGLRGAPFPDDATIASLLALANDAATTKNPYLQALAAAGSWAPADVTVLAGKEVPAGMPPDNGLLNVVFPDDFRDGEGIARIRACFKLLGRLGATAAQLAQWSQPDLADSNPSATQWARALANAVAIKNAVRSKYDESQWLAIAEPVQDKLRDRQRAALVGYLVASQKFGVDEFDLYDRFLIDVEMTACMLTTRLKLATCSVQLFIQRCLMNLEPMITLTPEAAQEWNTWRRLYRVWEANREVLLYPENWIEPELRDDKSPIFEDLENELLQNDITADTAEEAVRHYLEQLHQVARLEIVGLIQQPDAGDPTGAGDRLHVFGRTYAAPHRYFFRHLQGGVWSPWVKIDLDFEGDHLIPAVWDDHLYLCWPIFTEKTDHPTAQQQAANEDPTKYWEIKLAWSEYRHNKWLPKKLSAEPLTYVKDASAFVHQDPEDFKFISQVQTGAFGTRLVVDCYGTKVTRTTIPAQQPPPPPARPDVLILAAGATQLVTITFTVNQQQPTVADLAKITIKERNHADNTVMVTEHPVQINYLIGSATGVIVVAIKAADFYFVPGAYSAGTIQEGWAPPACRNVNVDLSPFHAASPAKPGDPTVVISTTPDWAVGRFQLDDCSGDVLALPVTQASPPIQPPGLEPMPGTQFVNMMMVEQNNFLDTFGSAGVLKRTPGTFRVLGRADSYTLKSVAYPFAYQDDHAAFLVQGVAFPTNPTTYKAWFQTFYHPWVCDFLSVLDRQGVAGLLTRDAQSLIDDPNRFLTLYGPDPALVDLDDPSPLDPIRRTPREDVDFTREGAYSQYNWEIFFHMPLLIATKLTKNQRFEEARTWFHYIFDPTSSEPGGRERFWRVRPFFEQALYAPQTLAEFLKAQADEFANELAAWQAHPFEPYVIARLRLLAFMKTVVMKYIENLIAWGDQLFGRDTIESINEATLLYVLAARILGKRPPSIPERARPTVQTFHTLDVQDPGAFFMALVDIESFVFPSAAPASPPAKDGTGSLGTMPLFCIPKNDMLLGYWDTVADRLFKIRHCMNIAGVVRELPIYDPPIDPGLLVRAAAAGVDLDSVLDDLYAPLPIYRYGVMQRRAADLCADVKALGAALLSALEKRDAETLAQLRSGHEVELLNAVRLVRQQQVDEAGRTLDGLTEYQKVVTARQQYYLSRPYMNSFETAHAQLVGASEIPMALQIEADVLIGIGHLVPDFKIGAFTTIGSTYGGSNIAGAASAFASALGSTASMLNTMGSLSATMGGYSRRQDDWTHQADLATKELAQVEKQIAAAEIRLAIAENELANQETQIAHAKDVDEFMREKYTNAELYDWMVGQISALYFQSYQLAYGVAKRAERCYRTELGLDDSSFIQFGYWDSLKKGLLAGERLQLDLRRMETDFAERNKREYEITKHVSVLALDPGALIQLREAGRCEIAIPEALFDLDCPGHYLRRIKSVSVTIPCVTGPYVGVNCTLTLLRSSVRSGLDVSAGYARGAPTDPDTRFVDRFGAIQSVVTSSGQNDSGLFETNLNDERYLPFEGAGAISTWRIELPSDFRSFDFATIADVILHLRYTARDGGGSLKAQVISELQATVNQVIAASGDTGLARLISLRYEYPTEWNGFIRPPAAGHDNGITIAFGSERFPFLFAGQTLNVDRVDLFIKVKPDHVAAYTADSLKTCFAVGPTAPDSGHHAPADVLRLAAANGLLFGRKTLTPATTIPPSTATQWTLDAWFDDGTGAAPLDVGSLEDILLVYHYTI